MKDYEDIIKRLPAPQPDVTHFKQALFRDLMHRQIQESHVHYRATLATVGAALALCMLLLSAFILNPDLPRAIHQRLWNESMTAQANLQTSADESWSNHFQDRTLSTSVSADQALIRRMFQTRYGQPDVQIQPIPGRGPVTIREFQVEPGKRVMVFTQVPETQPPTPRTIY